MPCALPSANRGRDNGSIPENVQFQAKSIAFVDHWENLLDRDSKELATWLFEELLVRLHLWRPEFRRTATAPMHIPTVALFPLEATL